MRVRRLFICLLAAAFVVSGAATRAWIALPAALAAQPSVVAHAAGHAVAENHDGAPAHDHTAHASHAAAAGHNADHAAGDAVAAVADQETGDHVDDCLKCCSMCNVTSFVPGLAATPVTFSYADIAFPVKENALVGHLVALDPDIPKAVV